MRDAVSDRISESNQAERREKRPKTHDFFPPKPPTPHPIEKEKIESSAAGGSKVVQRLVGSAEHAAIQEFVPSFALAEGRVVIVDDSVKLEPGLVVAMLRALLKDMERVPQDLQPSLVHASAYLVQVCPSLALSIVIFFFQA